MDHLLHRTLPEAVTARSPFSEGPSPFVTTVLCAAQKSLVTIYDRVDVGFPHNMASFGRAVLSTWTAVGVGGALGIFAPIGVALADSSKNSDDEQDGGKKKRGKQDTYFDPEALERGAKALREIQKSPYAKQVMATNPTHQEQYLLSAMLLYIHMYYSPHPICHPQYCERRRLGSSLG